MDFEAIICRECPTPIQWEVLRRHYVNRVNAAIKQRDACIADLEAQLTAANEAVRVLGEEVATWRKHCGSKDDCRTWRYHNDIEGERCVRHEEANATDRNPIASAAITDAAKAREGA